MSHDNIFALTMPKWGLTMEVGTIASWLFEEGDEIEVGSEILEVETDKITQSIESSVAGVLRRIIAEEGDEYPVQALLGIIAAEDVPDTEIDAFIVQHSSRAGEAEDGEEEPITPEPAQSAAIPMSKMRSAIVKTVLDSWLAPQFPVTMPIEMGAAKALRATLKAAGDSVSLNDIVMKASTEALKKYPMVNAMLEGKAYILNPEINIALAVSVDEDLLMPVLKGCEALSLTELAEKSRELIAKVKDGSIGEAELTGGNFAISNMGMFGIEQFAALVPPGMAAILAVGAIRDEVIIKAGEMLPAAMMRVTLVADHRIVDGVCAANYLVELKRLLENPEEIIS